MSPTINQKELLEQSCADERSDIKQQSRHKEFGESHVYQREEVNLGNLEPFLSTLAITTQTKKLRKGNIDSSYYIKIF